ncbi:MAG: hypothetical protein WHU10_11790, partial [Fimbriimonadales bacterium]
RGALEDVPGLLRIKGFTHDGSGLCSLDFDGQRWFEADAPDGATPSLVAIGLREHGDELRKALAWIVQNSAGP